MSEADLNVEHQSDKKAGRYSIKIADGPEAEMTYRRVNDTTISIDHTFVPNAYRGRGIAKILFDRAIVDARANNNKIIPTCSYVAAQFRHHPELSELLAKPL